MSGTGLDVEVRFVKKGGLPVTMVAGDAEDAAAIRQVDLQKKYHRSSFDLADAVGLSRPRATALRAHLGIDQDPDCLHVFQFGSQRHPRFSDNAFVRMRDAAATLDMKAVWTAHAPGPKGQPAPACKQPLCAASSSSATP